MTVSYRIVRKDRSVLYVTDTLRSVRDAHGGMRAYAIAMDDTFDELLLSGVSRASAHIPYPIACYDWSEQALSAVYCNEEFGSILNLAPAEYLALTARSPLSMVAEQSKRNIYRLLEQFEQGRRTAPPGHRRRFGAGAAGLYPRAQRHLALRIDFPSLGFA